MKEKMPKQKTYNIVDTSGDVFEVLDIEDDYYVMEDNLYIEANRIEFRKEWFEYCELNGIFD